jgi:cyclopropane fatty-acyl-phospholipid synthase-like methyltransferase
MQAILSHDNDCPRPLVSNQYGFGMKTLASQFARETLQGWSNDRYVAALATGYDSDNIAFPGFPSDDVQERFVGSSRSTAIYEALRFVERVKEEAAALGSPITEHSKVADFGAGWGRMIRCWLRDIPTSNLIAIEPVEWMVEDLRSWFPEATVVQSELEPPVNIGAGTVDVLYAYSVFSHLPERVATEWIKEIARVLCPGGIAVLTTQKRSFIDFCEGLRQDPSLQTTLWHSALAQSFVDVEAAHRAFDAGQFLYIPNGGGAELPADHYGDTVFSETFARAKWSEFLTVHSFTDDERCAQSVIVLHKPRNKPRNKPRTNDMSPIASPLTVGHLTDAAWNDVLLSSARPDAAHTYRMPTFPDEQTQTNFVGSAGEASLVESWKFWETINSVSAELGQPVRRSTNLLDFGTGWGRMIRPFLRQIDGKNILGVDPLPDMVELCQKMYAGFDVKFAWNNPLAPSTLGPGSVDLITGYSVFSHLNEQVSTDWIREFERILRPGGLVFITTHGVDILDYAEQLLADPSQQAGLWHELLASGFGANAAQLRNDYHQGNFVHAAHGGGSALDVSYYGDSLFNESFARKTWGSILDVVKFIPAKTEALPQSLLVLQKPRTTLGAPSAVRSVIETSAVATASSVSAASAELAQLRAELATVYQSETWKLGRALMWPVRRIRRER